MKEFTGYKRGINLGGWLSQCEHSEEHYNAFITENDLRIISGWGLDHIRLPIDYELVRADDDSFIEEGFAHIDRCLDWCMKYNLNMILDLHKTAGYSFDEKVDDFFRSSLLQYKFISLWEEIARRYGSFSNMLSFELLNEVIDESFADIWNDIIKRTISVIRKHAPKTKILIGGVRYNSVLWVRKLDEPYDENIVYTFHFYEPLIFTHQSAYWVEKMPTDFSIEYPNELKKYIEDSHKLLPSVHHGFYDSVNCEKVDINFFKTAFADAIGTAEERNTALYCGEYGVIDQASLSSTLNWFEDIHSVFEEFNIARAVWTYKGKDFGITDAHYSEIADKLIKLL